MSAAPLDLAPLAPALGAEVRGFELSGALPDEAIAAIRAALVQHGCLFFRDQKLAPEEQVALARRFGEPEVHPIVDGLEGLPELIRVWKPAGQPASFGVGWHADNTFLEEPSLGSILYGETIPPAGGDTLYASAERAHEALSPRMQAMLGELRAVHSASRAYDPGETGRAKYEGEGPLRYRWSDAITKEVEHPVVRTHPESGRRCLFVNPMFTQRIVDLAPNESEALLEMLYAHVARPEFTCRFRWTPGAVAMWDNRQVWHYAMDDYSDHERVVHRVTLAGDRPA